MHAAEIVKNFELKLSDGKNFNDPFELGMFNKRTREFTRKDGLHILCLTNSHLHKLMWSHYSDSHKGVCLTVEVPCELAYPVGYTGRRVYDDSNLDEILESVFSRQNAKRNLIKPYNRLPKHKRIAYIKDQKWAYEKEYRIVFDDNDPGLIKKADEWYMSIKIKNVYLGVRFNENEEEIKNNLIESCKQQNVSIKQIKLSSNSYSLQVK